MKALQKPDHQSPALDDQPRGNVVESKRSLCVRENGDLQSIDSITARAVAVTDVLTQILQTHPQPHYPDTGDQSSNSRRAVPN